MPKILTDMNCLHYQILLDKYLHNDNHVCLFAYTVQAELFFNSFFPTRNELKGFDSFSQNNL